MFFDLGTNAKDIIVAVVHRLGFDIKLQPKDVSQTNPKNGSSTRLLTINSQGRYYHLVDLRLLPNDHQGVQKYNPSDQFYQSFATDVQVVLNRFVHSRSRRRIRLEFHQDTTDDVFHNILFGYVNICNLQPFINTIIYIMLNYVI